MPTYEYKCKKCGKIFEAFHSMSAKSLTKCERPKCGGRVERLIGAGAGLIFKGTGFYITDYKKTSVSTDSKDVTPPKADKGASKPAAAKKDAPAKKKDDVS